MTLNSLETVREAGVWPLADRERAVTGPHAYLPKDIRGIRTAKVCLAWDHFEDHGLVIAIDFFQSGILRSHLQEISVI